jgi:hypothetical protein
MSRGAFCICSLAALEISRLRTFLRLALILNSRNLRISDAMIYLNYVSRSELILP